MKSKYKLALMFFISVFSMLVGFTDVFAATLVETPVENWYYTRRGGGKPYMSAQWHLYNMDGKTVYCIEPGVDITIHNYEGQIGWINSPYSDEVNQKIQLYGYYGYDYPGHQTLRYRAAAQSLIWEETGGQIVEMWTEASGWGDFINLNKERNEIKRLAAEHLESIALDSYSKDAVIGKTTTFTDSKNLLSQFEVVESEGATTSINGNILSVTPNKVGELTITLKKKTYTDNPTTIFVGTDLKSQKMGYFGVDDPVKVKVKLNVTGGKIQIKKIDSENDSIIAQGDATLIGAKYNVIDSNGNVVDTLTIGNDKTAISKPLALGVYKIKEVSAPTGYYLDNNEYTIEVTSSDTVYLTVEEDVIKGNIKVAKYDSETNSCKAQGQATLVGAKYNILNSKGEVVDTLTIGDDCSSVSKQLPYGRYTIKEISAPTGYYLDNNTYTVDVKNSDTILVVSKDEVVKGKIKINKYDSETNSCKALGQATLVGAKFNVLDHNKNIVDTITIGNDCSAVTKYLPYGNYTIKEVSSPKGYYLTNEVFEQFVGENKEYSIVVKNEVIKNYISILKQYDYVNGNTTFLNAEANITFEIFYPDGTKYGEVKTDKNGYATLDIPYGVWKFHQVNSNTGFEKIYDFFITVDEDSEKEQYYNILNNKIAAYLQVIKKDSETGKTIAIVNTKFKILNTDTNQYVSQYVGGKVYDSFMTDETGKFTTYLKLEAGNYRLIEIDSPHGYLISKEGLDFTIGENTEYNFTTYGAIVLTEFKNSPIKGIIEVYKTGENYEINDGEFEYETIKLSGTKFNLYAAEDIKSADGNHLYYNKGDLVEVLITKDGYVKSKQLPLGKYYLVEVETDINHILNNEKQYIELTEIDNKTAIVYESKSVKNYYKKSTLEFTKTDFSTHDPIPNTTIEVYMEMEGKDILIGKYITDKDGKVVIKDMPVIANVKYYILETNASEGYILNTEKMYFSFKENGEVVKSNMTNEKITSIIKIVKVDEEGNTLAGVKIGIYDLEGNEVGVYTTNEFGEIEVELEYNKYMYKEIETLEGYVLDETEYYFDVVKDNEIIELTLVNELIEIEIPNTSSNSYMIFVPIVMLGTGLILLIVNKRKKKEEK